MRKFTISATLALTTALFAGDAAAEHAPTCAKRPLIVENLAKKYNETLVSVGLMSNGNLLEVYAAADGSTWTLITTSPDGESCVEAAGTDWNALEPLPTEGKRA